MVKSRTSLRLWHDGLWLRQREPAHKHDSTQAVTDSQLYDAFGNTVSRTGTTPTPFGFVGKAQYQSDSDSGLQLLGHRYYDPSIGRFLSSDPIQDGDNWYAYCGNNPINRADALGTSWISIGLGVVAGVAVTLFTGNPVLGVVVGVGVGTAVSHWGEGNDWTSSATDGCAAGMIVPLAVAVAMVAVDGLAIASAGGGGVIGSGSGGNSGGAITSGGATSGGSGTSFIGTSGGDVIPIPRGATGPVPVINLAGNTTGFGYVGGTGGWGMDPRTTTVRIMDPTPPRGISPGYSSGSVTYQNGGNQGVNPYTGQTIPNSDPWRHLRLR